MQSESDVRTPLLLVLLSLQAAGCAHAKGPYIDCSFHGPAMVAVLASHPLARLQRTGCYGWCPQYAVEVDIDGVVTYVGHEFVMTMGPATGNLSAEQLRSLRKAVALAGHSEMPHERCACGCVADAPDVILTIWERGIPITVTYDDGCARIPAAIHALEAEVERAVGIERWIGTREARRACFEENRDCSSLSVSRSPLRSAKKAEFGFSVGEHVGAGRVMTTVVECPRALAAQGMTHRDRVMTEIVD